MKAEELRIGNWVYDETRRSNVQIEDLSFDYVNGNFRPINIEKTSPIPLTEQWLIDFGFEKDDTGVDIHDQDYHEWYQKEFPIIGILCQSSDKAYLFDENTDTLRIKYVHQLQNLYYALTGEDLL